MAQTWIRCTTALGLALALAAVSPASAQVRTPATSFTRTTPSLTPEWGEAAGRQVVREGGAATGTVFGALVGAVAGLVVGTAACQRCDDGAPVMAAVGVGAAAGAVLGFFFGLRSLGD